jgi:hypothetical protein
VGVAVGLGVGVGIFVGLGLVSVGLGASISVSSCLGVDVDVGRCTGDGLFCKCVSVINWPVGVLVVIGNDPGEHATSIKQKIIYETSL